jgi:hypothetical protein
MKQTFMKAGLELYNKGLTPRITPKKRSFGYVITFLSAGLKDEEKWELLMRRK